MKKIFGYIHKDLIPTVTEKFNLTSFLLKWEGPNNLRVRNCGIVEENKAEVKIWIEFNRDLGPKEIVEFHRHIEPKQLSLLPEKDRQKNETAMRLSRTYGPINKQI